MCFIDISILFYTIYPNKIEILNSVRSKAQMQRYFVENLIFLLFYLKFLLHRIMRELDQCEEKSFASVNAWFQEFNSCSSITSFSDCAEKRSTVTYLVRRTMVKGNTWIKNRDEKKL